MDLVLVNGYAHAGILQLMSPGVTECILSADLDYLAKGQGEALNYESYLDWAVKNDVITLLHSGVAQETMVGLISSVAGNRDGHTIYAFLGYPGAVVGAFQPIPRNNNDYWYCSKVAARVYDPVYPPLLDPFEDADFHWEPYGSGQRWNVVQQSLLYKVYVCYLKLLFPWKPLTWRISQANLALQGVLAELVTPDELRASEKLEWAFSVTPAGNISEAQEAALLGWDTYQDK
jgi:hypothetical protein